MGARKEDIEAAKDKKIEKQGMVYERSCTDSLCCVIFMAFLVVMIAVSGYALTTGDPLKIMTPYDSDGNRCGFPDQDKSLHLGNNAMRDFTEYKYKLYTDLDVIVRGKSAVDLSYYNAVCVKKCPSFNSANEADVPATLELNNMETSQYAQDYVFDPIGNADINEAIKIQLSDTKEKAGQCIIAGAFNETMYQEIYGMIQKQVNVGFGAYIRGIADAWPVLAIMAVVTLIITLIYIFLLRCITKPILYGSLFAIFLCLLGITAYMYMVSTEISDKESDDFKVAIGATVVFGLLTLIFMFCICCMWSAIALGACVMETASDFIGSNKGIVGLPFIAYLLCVPIITWWTATAVYIYGLGEPSFKENSFVAEVEMSEQSAYLFLFEMFGMFWLVAWIIAIQIFITGAVVCMWYFSGQGSDIGDESNKGGVWLAIKWAFRFHLGSLAWGSFLVAVITMIRVIFEYIVYQYEKTQMKENIVFKCITCYIRCILKCLDMCIKFINKNAYIQIALHNSAFCEGARESFYLMARNSKRFSAVSLTGAILLFIGKILITSSCVFLTIVLINAQYPEIEQPFIPAMIIAIFAYVIASLFLAVFDFSALTILHCFCLDEEQGGSRNTPNGLKKFLDMDPETQIKNPNASQSFDQKANEMA